MKYKIVLTPVLLPSVDMLYAMAKLTYIGTKASMELLGCKFLV